MTKIYNSPREVKIPKFNWENVSQYEKDCETYYKELKEFLLKRKNGKNVGETIQFPVADNYAVYMVASMKPLELVHIPLWDGYSFEYVNRLTAKDVQDKIDQQKALTKLFSK
jgi:hypothetical protein